MNNSNIFLSYSHNDEDLFELIVSHFSFAMGRDINVYAWKDDNPSARQSAIIKNEIEASKVAILIITAEFLASKAIQEFELRLLLQRSKENKVRIIPIIGKPCAWLRVPWLRNLQVIPSHDQTLIELDEIEKHRLLESLAKDIFDLLNQKTELVYQIPIQNKENKAKNEKFIFISHCSDDGDFAELLKLRLEKNGFKGWIDIERLKVGEDWRLEIDDTIKKSIALIVIMTKEARESEYVTYEWAFGLGANIKIIPILLNQTQLHPRLESLQYLDFTNRRARPWDTLIERLNEI